MRAAKSTHKGEAHTGGAPHTPPNPLVSLRIHLPLLRNNHQHYNILEKCALAAALPTPPLYILAHIPPYY